MARGEWTPRIHALADAVAALRRAANDTLTAYDDGILDGINELRDMPLDEVRADQERAAELFRMADEAELQLHAAVREYLDAKARPPHTEGAIAHGVVGCTECGIDRDSERWREGCRGKGDGV